MKLRFLTLLIGGGFVLHGSAQAQDSTAPAAEGAATAHLLTLAQALRSARTHQPALDLARGSVATAVGLAEQARSGLLPQINGTAGLNRATNNVVPAPGGNLQLGGQQSVTSSFTSYSFWSTQLSATQLIYDFGESINRWKAARVNADASVEGVHITEAQIDYNTRVAFFSARAAKDLVGVTRDTLANQEKHLGQVQGFVEVGTHPEIDLAQARADRATAQLQFINAENNYAVARATLNLAMGIERSIDYDLSDEDFPIVEGEEGTVEDLVGEAKLRRPEMVNQRLTMQSQELSLRSANDMIWPALTASGFVNDRGPDLDHTNWNLSGTLSFTVPIFQGGAIRAQIHQAEGQLTQAKAQVATQSLQVRLDVEQARLGIRAAKASILSAEDALGNSRARLGLAEGRYQAGAGSIIELGDAQVAGTTAAAQRVQTQYQLYTARAQLLKALGRTR